MGPLAEQLHAQKTWAPLAGLGDLTAVGFRLTNAGRRGAAPSSTTSGIASSSWATCEAGAAGALCPPGLSRSTFNQFYYPAYPLAGLSTVAIDGSCSVSIDPARR